MSYLTHDKLVICGAAGAIGSNMVQAALSLNLTPNIVMYDPFEKGLEGAAEEIYHCAFPGANVTWTTDIAEALRGASYIISSGGAPRKEGMTREDLLKGNCEIAAQLGRDIRANCPDVKLVAIIFNPADITGLTVLVHSGLPPPAWQRWPHSIAHGCKRRSPQHFKLPQDEVTGCRTYGGHGEQMAVFASTAAIAGKPLSDLIGTDALPNEKWEAIKEHVRQGGKRIIQLRGRSSYQSPAHQSVLMIKAAIDGHGYPWPVGTYVDTPDYEKITMAMETTLNQEGVLWTTPSGTDEEIAALRESYSHLAKLRDEVIAMGVLPPLNQWKSANPHL